MPIVLWSSFWSFFGRPVLGQSFAKEQAIDQIRLGSFRACLQSPGRHVGGMMAGWTGVVTKDTRRVWDWR